MVNNNTKQHKFLMQGSILAFAGILVRLIGLLYRIPMNAIIGTEGNGYYTSAYSVYSLFLILSSYSFPTAISKIISQRLANSRFLDVKNVIRNAFVLAFFVGGIMFLIMYFGSNGIAFLLRKPLLCFSLRALAPTLFIMAFLGVLRGVFQGMGNMIPTAISQVFEQIVNAFTSIVFAFILFNRGKIANLVYESTEYSYAFGASGGAIGTGLGAMAALAILLFMFFTLMSRYRRFLNNNNYYDPESNSTIFNVLMMTIVPIVISSTIYNITSVIDDLLFSNVMTFMKTGANIVILWGIYGQYHLLFNIPVAIANSLTSSVIPSISHSVAINDVREVVLKVKYSIKYTMLIVIPSFVGLLVLAEPICKVLFNGDNVDTLINVLRIGSIAVVFFSLSTVTNGILQGLGLFNKPVKNAFFALIVHIISAFILLIVFKLNIYAIIIALIIFSLTLSILNQHDINKVIKYKNSSFQKRYIITYILMIFSSVIMGVCTYALYEFLSNVLFAGDGLFIMILKLIICIIVAVVVYGILIIFLGVVRKRDAAYIPFISKFSMILRG